MTKPLSVKKKSTPLWPNVKKPPSFQVGMPGSQYGSFRNLGSPPHHVRW
jgi:hypothetical protein